MGELNVREKKFVKNVAMGKPIKDSAKLAGYSDSSSTSYAYQLLRKDKIKKALDRAGLSDAALAKFLKKGIKSGLGVKATNSDSLRGLEILAKIKGYLDRETPDNLSQTNIYINELNNMTDSQLIKKLEEITTEVKELKSSKPKE